MGREADFGRMLKRRNCPITCGLEAAPRDTSTKRRTPRQDTRASHLASRPSVLGLFQPPAPRRQNASPDSPRAQPAALLRRRGPARGADRRVRRLRELPPPGRRRARVRAGRAELGETTTPISGAPSFRRRTSQVHDPHGGRRARREHRHVHVRAAPRRPETGFTAAAAPRPPVASEFSPRRRCVRLHPAASEFPAAASPRPPPRFRAAASPRNSPPARGRFDLRPTQDDIAENPRNWHPHNKGKVFNRPDDGDGTPPPDVYSCRVDIPPMNRGDAVAATWIFR